MPTKLLTPSYTFTPGAAGAGILDLYGIDGFDIRQLVAVINLTRGVILYAPTVAGFVSIAGTKIALAIDTSAHSATDKLWIKYDDGAARDAEIQMLSQLVRGLLDPVWVDPVSGRLRVVLDPIGGTQTLSTVNTVSTVTNMSQIGAVPADHMLYNTMQTTWATSIRPAIT